MSEDFDRAALVDQFARLVPGGLTRELLVAYGKEVDATVPGAVETLREIGEMFHVDQRELDGILNPLTPPAPHAIDEEAVVNARRTLFHVWLKALVEVRGMVDDSAPVALTSDLLPDPAQVDGELCEAARATIDTMCQGYTLDVGRVRTLYAAFVAALTAEFANKTERIPISDSATLVVANGRFSLENRTD